MSENLVQPAQRLPNKTNTKQECVHNCEFADMESTFTALAFFCCLLLLANTMEARKDPGEYWRSVTRDQPMPRAIEGLVNSDTKPIQPTLESFQVVQDFNHKCKQTMAAQNEGAPNISSFGDKDVQSKQSFATDFEPRPSATSYVGDDFEPRPNLSAYGDDEVKEKHEPKPNVSALEDMQRRPNLSV